MCVLFILLFSQNVNVNHFSEVLKGTKVLSKKPCLGPSLNYSTNVRIVRHFGYGRFSLWIFLSVDVSASIDELSTCCLEVDMPSVHTVY